MVEEQTPVQARPSVEEERDPEAEARREFALAQVRQYPDAVLRMRARGVEDFEQAASLSQRMISIMTEARGVGLAAPQVGVLQRIVVYQVDADSDPQVLLNPTVSRESEEREFAEEGCLSLARATVNVDVERAASVSVLAIAIDGDPIEIEAEGLEARIIQHEVDHLDGVLIIDRTSPEQRRGAMAELRPRPTLGRA
ncbi:MAG: peptide deformylase [Gaiellales bacterium]